ncbi:MAG: hypothetical protein A2W31_08080 [Planctomycetes bacterium RBG_16_64_10]|nr:MAG: hypothetical protein A2W31_08080 [Planctomycetes bacterium RBG_16_64_10]
MVAKSATLHEPHSGAVHQLGHQAINLLGHGFQQPSHLVDRQDDGQPNGPLGTNGIEQSEFEPQYVAVEEQEGTKRLVLGAGNSGN